MAHYQLAWKAATKEVVVQAKGDALPVGYTKLVADIEHVMLGAESDAEGSGDSHVIWHHVRDEMYKLGILDMSTVKIALDAIYVALVSIVIAPATVTLTVAAPTAQLTITPTPGDASNTTVTWVSSDPTKATVSATGLVTRVANGSTTITATSEDGAKVATRTVTTTA